MARLAQDRTRRAPCVAMLCCDVVGPVHLNVVMTLQAACNLAHFSGLQFIKMKINTFNTESMPIILNKNQSTSIIINHTHHDMNPRLLMVKLAKMSQLGSCCAQELRKKRNPARWASDMSMSRQRIDFLAGKRNPGWCLLQKSAFLVNVERNS